MLTLTDRDKKILETLNNFKYMSYEQLQRLFFITPLAGNDRLYKLINYKYLEMQEVAGKRICCLARLGRQMLNIKGRKIHPPVSLLDHILAVNDFYINLKLACNGNMQVFKFLPEYQIKTTLSFHTADAGITLSKNNKSSFFFLEVDKSNQSWYIIRDKLFNYLNVFTPNDKFRLLIVCDTQQRLTSLRTKALDYFNNPVFSFFWIKCQPIDETNVLTGWQSLGDDNSYDIR